MTSLPETFDETSRIETSQPQHHVIFHRFFSRSVKRQRARTDQEKALIGQFRDCFGSLFQDWHRRPHARLAEVVQRPVPLAGDEGEVIPIRRHLRQRGRAAALPVRRQHLADQHRRRPAVHQKVMVADQKTMPLPRQPEG